MLIDKNEFRDLLWHKAEYLCLLSTQYANLDMFSLYKVTIQQYVAAATRLENWDNMQAQQADAAQEEEEVETAWSSGSMDEDTFGDRE